MGQDGGCVPKRSDLVRLKNKNTTKRFTCKSSYKPLNPPIVIDSSGRLHNKRDCNISLELYDIHCILEDNKMICPIKKGVIEEGSACIPCGCVFDNKIMEYVILKECPVCGKKIEKLIGIKFM
ncbi:hypothetical protein TCON_0611 [Astathelohania contejeani]|uniref:Uncharacterized protein n=1 Tax=Astathelohania contejeani TaxID=164912 RepID=A0ABQ7I171_9MICR|nr:hypothetical protein TCON_0611 [Thelohania contejeani]